MSCTRCYYTTSLIPEGHEYKHPNLLAPVLCPDIGHMPNAYPRPHFWNRNSKTQPELHYPTSQFAMPTLMATAFSPLGGAATERLRQEQLISAVLLAHSARRLLRYRTGAGLLFDGGLCASQDALAPFHCVARKSGSGQLSRSLSRVRMQGVGALSPRFVHP